MTTTDINTTDAHNTHRPITTAAVLGASMAGLLAARALSETCDRVIILERDTIRGVTTPRRGVPQGAHVHGLMARGQQILEELFPGFTEEALSRGIPTADLGELRWFFNGKPLRPATTGLTCVSADRPILEDLVRRRVLDLPNVHLLENVSVCGLLMDDTNSRVIGVARRREGSPRVEETPANLVVDCTGRGSQTPRWLREAGFDSPTVESVPIGLSYTSRHFRVINEDILRGDLAVNPVSCPAHPRGAFFTRVQNGTSIVSLTGMAGDRAPTDYDGFLKWAESIVVPDVADIIKASEPLNEGVSLHYTASRRHHYENLQRFPDGVLVMGDAFCSFNPVYGQGMTVAALEALELRDATRSGAPIAADFHQRISEVVDPPWQQSAAGDLMYGAGPIPEPVLQANQMTAMIQKAATVDPEVTRTFMRVAGLVDPPTHLMTPEMQARIQAAVEAADAAESAETAETAKAQDVAAGMLGDHQGRPDHEPIPSVTTSTPVGTERVPDTEEAASPSLAPVAAAAAGPAADAIPYGFSVTHAPAATTATSTPTATNGGRCSTWRGW